MACGQIDAQTAFSLPAVPDTLRTAEKRAAYLLVHYWDSMDFNWPDVKSAEVEQAFADFASVLPVGTNVSVLFFDKSASSDKVILIDASKLGEEYKDANGLKKVRLSNDEIERIVTTFLNKEAVDDFSVAVTYDEIKEKGYSLSAGQYFDIKIDYLDITEEEFNKRMTDYKNTLTQQFEESHHLEAEIMKQLDCLGFNNVTR